MLKALKSRRKTFLLLAMLLSGGVASAQVTVKGNVYGGGEYGQVTENASVTIREADASTAKTIIEGSVFGGGKGATDDEKKGWVKGNTTVTMYAGQVMSSIYGGGELGSVGTYTDAYVSMTNNGVEPPVTMHIPVACESGTGLATVNISGGLVGLNNILMPTTLHPEGDEYGYVFCGSQGEADSLTYPIANQLGIVGSTSLHISGTALIAASAYGGSENGLVLGNTNVQMSGGQIGIGHYKTKVGDEWQDHWDGLYSEDNWTNAINAVIAEDADDINDAAALFHECDAFPYGIDDDNNPSTPKVYYVYDIFANDPTHPTNDPTHPAYHTSSIQGSNGHSFFGNLFGGGSGFYPFRPGVWRRTAGQVNGNTEVTITGGHILTSIYGGNEYTDVKGKCTVKMSGGTLGVPRTLDSIAAHPVTCYLFGAGMGDPRILFNTWTHVNNVEVEVSGGTIFGSVFGGGEEGHVLNDVKLTISKTTQIGTWGYSYVDGNVFGAGRGFSGEALTAGVVGGNIDIDILGGKMLGSVYGGGRLASVGTEFASPTIPDPSNPGQVIPNPHYGHMQDGTAHGNINIQVGGTGQTSDVTIGNNYESYYHHRENPKGGNIFGGSMGRLTKLDGEINDIWPNLGMVKSSTVTIGQASGKTTLVKGNVYGGGEFGRVTENTSITIADGNIWHNVFGGGFGSEDYHLNGEIEFTDGTTVTTAEVSPLQWAGRVEGTSSITMNGGWVRKCIYGGGEFASVGVVSSDTLGVHKHTDVESTFAISWPYEFTYTPNNGKVTININGGRIGLTGNDYLGPWNVYEGVEKPVYYAESDINELTPILYDLTTTEGKKALKDAREDNGDVFGGSKGKAGDRYVWAHGANINDSEITINIDSDPPVTPTNYKPTYSDENLDFEYVHHPTYSSWTTYGTRACIPGAVYGGGENGHVIGDASVTLTQGLVGHNIYGGGKGSDKYRARLLNPDYNPEDPEHYPQYIYKDITSVSAGRVYGNTHVTMNDGYVVRNIFGGGNKASVGKGNYAGGPGDYSTAGYGERWPSADSPLRQVLANSGHTYVHVYGGTVGTVNGMKDDIPTGNVFGSCRGEAAPNVDPSLSPRLFYFPEFFLGYVNHTEVIIGNATGSGDGPTLFGSVYGGGQDGHVRWQTDVTVNKGEIGNEYTAANITAVGTGDLDNYQWAGRGNVHGAGAGVGKYTGTDSQKHYSTSAGSVTQFTNVTINGGTIHQNVHGGGPLASVGPPRIGQPNEATYQQTHATVNINSTIGTMPDAKAEEYGGHGYGGNVYGASRGIKNNTSPAADLVDFYKKYGTVIYTEVNVGTGAHVLGNVYGGGELCQVKQDTKVDMTGGTVGTIEPRKEAGSDIYTYFVHTSGGKVFGGGKGRVKKPTTTGEPSQEEIHYEREAALVKGNTEVIIRGGQVWDCVYGGGELASVGQRTEYTYTNTVTKGGITTTEEFTDYKPVANTGLAKVSITGGQVGPAPKVGNFDDEEYNIPVGLNGRDGYVYGGGMGIGNDLISAFDPEDHPYSGKYYEIADVNNTLVIVNIPSNLSTTTNRIWGSIFGGAQDGHVLGDAVVHYKSGLMGTNGTTSYDGNIFGGGRNYEKKNYNAGRVRGNIYVHMCGGQIYGSIFGGGRLALTGVDLYGNIIPDGTDDTFGTVNVRVNGGTVGNDSEVTDPTYGTMPYIMTFTEHSMGDVFGGGKGDMEGIVGHPPASALLVSLVKNTNVLVTDTVIDNNTVSPKILGSVFGGGEVACVGHFDWDLAVDDPYHDIDPTPYHPTETTIGNILMRDGTGITRVTVEGGQIGVDKMRMYYDIASGTGNYNLKYNCDLGHVFGGGEGRCEDPENYATHVNPGDAGFNDEPLIDYVATVGDTYVTIRSNDHGSAWVKGSVYGGAMNGHVLRDTDVTIAGGVIGAGYNPDGNDFAKYEAGDEQGKLFNPLTTPGAFLTTGVNAGDVDPDYALAECDHWIYDANTNRPFNAKAIKEDTDQTHANTKPTDGKTWFGNVFGGGSGYYPYYKETSGVYQPYWNRESGKVYGNATVNITGGHILTSIYGGCENTDVGHFTYDPTNGGTFVGVGDDHTGGVVSVTMSGGTLGVPRTFDQISDHPVTCYLFGAGKGDPRVQFNTWTNVKQATATVEGGIIYGSIFGGGEDGHVFYNAYVNVSEEDPDEPTIIGTTGRSYVDGNVFGGGRGFSGEALTAGVVRGDVDVNIKGGTMLGSIYGGGRLASVGTYLVPSNHANYGKMIPNGTDGNHGTITVDITGGTIGNDYEAVYHTDLNAHPTGGNVFTGGMGRLEKLDGTTNNMWRHTGNVKKTILTINEDDATTIIKGNVYGGGEFGIVEEDASITIEGGTLWRDVYGSGYGSDNTTSITDPITDETHTPMQLAGLVKLNTTISVTGGWIKKCIYGGGEFASVGTITSSEVHPEAVGTTPAHSFNLSWPYAFTYETNTGLASISVTGGRVGITGKDFMGPYAWIEGVLVPVKYNAQGEPTPLNATEIKNARVDNGDLYGGGKGKAGDRYEMAQLANVNNTIVSIDIDASDVTPQNYTDITNASGTLNSCVAGAVYGGAENGHVNNDTRVTLTNGLVGHSMYGGGKGKGQYTATLWHYDPATYEPTTQYQADIYSITAGKVYGNTYVTVEGGYVVRNVFGGGNLGSVGKGNYAGGKNVSIYAGFTDPDDYSVNGYGEKIDEDGAAAGYWDYIFGDDDDDFNGSGKCTVNIKGGIIGMLNSTDPEAVYKDDTPYGSVFGGCRGVAVPTVPRQLTPRYMYCPEDFLGYTNFTEVTIGDDDDTNDDPVFYGSIYGGAQDGHVRWNTVTHVKEGVIGVPFTAEGIAAVGNSVVTSKHWQDRGNVYGAGSGIGKWKDESNVEHYCNIAGSVTQFSTVTIDGGTIYNSVFGGGNLATVGPPRITQSFDCPKNKTGVTVNINGGTIGQMNDDYYGGFVYGASRGKASNNVDDFKNFALCSYTEVNITGGDIATTVYGGASNGQVGVYHENSTTHKEDGENIHNTLVNITGGHIFRSVYGGGEGKWGEEGYANDTISGRVLGSTEVNLTGGIVGLDDDNYEAIIFGGSRSANLWGSTTVNVGADSRTLTGSATIYGSVYGANNHKGTPYGDVNVNIYKTAHTGSQTAPEPYTGLGNSCPNPGPTSEDPETAVEQLRQYPKNLENYAIKAVYGGGNLAAYTPKADANKSTVHVYECRENTVCEIYGGGNAADVGKESAGFQTDTYLIVDGGRFHRLFGGGNGEEQVANIYGSTNTTINGGLFDVVFGGSNNNGIVAGTINFTKNLDSGCKIVIDTTFTGNNFVDHDGDVITEIICETGGSEAQGVYYGGSRYGDIYGNVIVNVYGGRIGHLFAGSCGDMVHSADILDYRPEYIEWYNAQPENAGHPIHAGEGGNVTLNLYGGTITNAYGGSDENGQIAGKITVNVFDEGGDCGLQLTNLYGGGRKTTYEPTLVNFATTHSPEVNLIHGTVLRNVYGGSRGAAATTKSSPEVNIGYNSTTMSGLIPAGYEEVTRSAIVKGNVFGGGDAAPVTGLEGNINLGNTVVNVRQDNSIVGETTIGSTTTIEGNVYGGGDDGTVDGNSTVNIYDGEVGKIEYSYKKANSTHTVFDTIVHVKYDETNYGGMVFGGGQGGTDNAELGRVKGNSTVNISGGHVQFNVYGGGEMASVGLHEAVYETQGEETVLVDLVPVANTGLATVNITGGQVGPAPMVGTIGEEEYDIPIALSGVDGYVFGGGKGNGDDVNSVYKTFANVNQTSVTVNIPSDANTTTNRIWGSIFGGAEDGHVLGDAYAYYLSGLMGTDGTTSYDGNIFGGGRNYNRINTTAGRVGGNTHVEMRNGQIYGNIYGGGRLALTGTGLNGIIALEGNRYQALRDDPDANTKKYGHTFVEVKGGTVGNNNPVSVTVGESTETMPFIETFSDNSMGNVYGGGKGSVEGLVGYPAASAMLVSLVKSTNVEISGTLTGTRIWGIVFGGGELACVGNYSWEQSGGYSGTVSNIHISDGLAKVSINGGTIGADRAKMRYEPGEGEYAKYPRFNDDLGYVYGGGEGLADDPNRLDAENHRVYPDVQVGSTSATTTSLLNLLATVNNTDVRINGGLVKASVFGGAESGHVRGDARVTLKGGQVGVGDNGTSDEPVYTDGHNGTPNRFINPVVTEVTSEPGENNTLYGTYHWDFGRDVNGTIHYDPYDPSEMARGGIPSDGKSWFGNVFGGGSGWFPYITGAGTQADPFVSHWNPDAGKVWGDTYVVIADSIRNEEIVSSPHILNNVYGANEATDVGGKATITMSGGTVGVPRTKAQVDQQPIICYVFGGGAGDPRTVFDNINNVGSTEVNITGGIVYGSVFGGAEDGHVLGNVDLNVEPGTAFTVGEAPNAITYTYPVIGSTGMSGADGNIFCGGRNYMGDNLKAGRVEGNITLNMSGGTLLGSVFGGGRYALTGIDANGAMITTDPTLHGNTDITISGGTVGNERKILAWLAETDHTSMGDVFAGGKGHIKHQDLGKVKNSKVTITGTAWVLGSVFGGGELANVGWYNSTNHSCETGTGRADVFISGGQVGLEQNGTFQPNIVGGNVYGGGYGRPGDGTAMNYGNVDNTHVNISGGYIVSSVFGGGEDGHVWNDTEITMVSTETNENGGIVGQRNTLAELLIDEEEQVSTTHIYTGSVLGGGRGIHQASGSYSEMTGRVFGNTNVTISGGTVRRAVYGGGGLASVGTYTRDGSVFTFTKGGTCTVTVNGKAIIGPTKADLTGTATDAELAAAAAALGMESMNQAQYVAKAFRYLGGNAGWVFGAGCGLCEPECNNLTYNKETVVAVGGEAQVVGSVYGGGENGRVYEKTNVTVNGSAIIGGFPLHGSGNMTIGGTGVYAGAQFESDVDELDEDIYGAGRHVFRGNVYGGGKGTDKYQDASEHMVYNNTSGRVFDSTKVTIGGSALIYNRVYGGGHMASVGTFTYYPGVVPSSVPLSDALQRIAYSEGSGMSRVRIEGGTIGTDGNNNGDVVGGGRGLAGNPGNDGAPIDDDDIADQVVRLAYVGSTDVIVSAGDIKSNVYGGSINGHVHGDSHVKVSGGTIGYKYKPTGETNEVVHGAWHSNVFGGGGGTHRYTKMVTPSGGGTPYPIEHLSITSGRVYGNSTVEIEGGTIWHNVYGGGAIASVGTYDLRNNAPKPIIDGTGTATVTVTGGTIGLNGDQNGIVFGSGRGQICNPDVNPENYSDSLSYTANTIVNIGTSTSSGSPVVKGSVYGSGENGHVYQKATVNVYKGTIGDTDYNATLFPFRGNVYGSGCGTDMYDSDNNGTKDSYNPTSGLVWGETEVNIHGGTISRNVYGGGAMASVGTYIRDGSGNVTGIVDGTGNTVVNISGGTIGTTDHTDISGDVYGGSRGPSGGEENGFQDKALVDKAFVNISGTTTDTKVFGSVYGGGNKSVVRTARVVTMNGGTVYQDVFGGSNSALDASNPPTPYTSLKTVNIRDGHIMGNVFSCSNAANEKGDDATNPDRTWTGFVNISGGQIDGNVYAAGKGGEVNGSVCLMVGPTAIANAPTYVNPMIQPPVQANVYRYYGLASGDDLTPKKTKIVGSLYGGSHHIGGDEDDHWDLFDVKGYSALFVDGEGYNTETSNEGSPTPYMNLGGGIFGSGEHCESGLLGREIIIRNYGHRSDDTQHPNELVEATRTLTTIQRGGVVLLDHSNVNLTGALSISNPDDPSASNYDATNYGMYKVDLSLYVANGGGIVLGSKADGETPAVPAYMDSITQVKSLFLDGTLSSYNQIGAGNNSNWEVVGIMGASPAAAHLYRLKNVGGTITPTLLEPAQENVIIFNDASQLHLRYTDKKTGDEEFKNYYGELQGFFRMRADYYDPHGTESFAYARPKITDGSVSADNTSDGGFLSYTVLDNDFTDNGLNYSSTYQYPYRNVLQLAKDDRQEYRLWVDAKRPAVRWYVDGRETGGWGDDTKTKLEGAGLYPDKPKKTLFGTKTVGEEEVGSGIISESYTGSNNRYNYLYSKDLIYIVGALSARDEKAILCDSVSTDDGSHTPLVLYRYPGHHVLSNGLMDEGTGTIPTWGLPSGNAAGPGANYHALIDVQGQTAIEEGAEMTLRGVVLDGLYGTYTAGSDTTFTAEELTTHQLSPDYYKPTDVDKPMILTHKGSELTLEGVTVDDGAHYGNTVLKRGYNKTDAALWYTNPDYKPYNASGVMNESQYHGGALFVDSLATVNVSGLVTITDNWQKKGSGSEASNVVSNVYLPTFSTKLIMTDAMRNYDEGEPAPGGVHVHSSIGVTSPKRNRKAKYELNTLSPVAVANKVIEGYSEEQLLSLNAGIATEAWTNNNFTDDQSWFFGNGDKTTYHTTDASASYMDPQSVYFGWTWANVVREAPTGFAVDAINSAEDLAWLISLNTGMNGVASPTDFSTSADLVQTGDIDLGQYVWVPIGISDDTRPFAGNYDGRGHIIANMNIRFIGNGDTRYQRKHYGLFGYVKSTTKGNIKRTFVVSGEVMPELAAADSYNLGGLIGCLEGGSITNSEAALNIICPDLAGTGIVTGGLVANMVSGSIHSSMAMPSITTKTNSNGPVGGLVGSATAGDIRNSFVNGNFVLDGAPKAGGLMGVNTAATMKNCYANWSDNPGIDHFKGVVYTDNSTAGNIDVCYYKETTDLVAGDAGSRSKSFTSTDSSDKYGYMYEDNKVQESENNSQPLFKLLNRWAYQNNTTADSTYAHWARPGLVEINGDYPVLLLNEFDGTYKYQGNFRSVGSYARSAALQYGGPVRDGNEIQSALTRPRLKDESGNDIIDCLFIYGDIDGAMTSLTSTQYKISIHEDATFHHPDVLNGYGNTYVGVTFDNSCGKATSTPTINYGLMGYGAYPLPRDWHMFSTPLKQAPLGFDYQGNNDPDGPSNNPWVSNNEFSWLNGGGPGNVRYWMYGWDNSLSQTNPNTPVNTSTWIDGYFPSRTTEFGAGWIDGADEWGRYPYGMDFYTWNEPQYHWINFKRNGPNHWHSDESPDGSHAHLDYKPAAVIGEDDPYDMNVNEENLIVGRGYMASIATETFMQSHGELNAKEQSIVLTNTVGSKLPGWNLVGNPYHGYLDFDAMVDNSASGDGLDNYNLLAKKDGINPFYVVYDADAYGTGGSGGAKEDKSGTAFRYYVATCSRNGDYAGRYLHPHQGFYVQKETTGSGALKFNEGMVVTRQQVGNNGHFRDDHVDYPLVNLYLSSDKGCADVTVIELERPEWGGARKLKELRVGDGLFYAHHDGTYYAALFAEQGVDRIPLWFEPKEDDIFTINWNTANGEFYSMYLIDNIAGVQYDMLMNDTYTFEAHKGDYPSRFLIVFNVTGVDEIDDNDNPHFVINNGTEWIATGDGLLQFIDVNGQVLWEDRVSGQRRVSLPWVADGPYLFRLINSKETKVQKVIITKY